jgi:hypothetical protein
MLLTGLSAQPKESYASNADRRTIKRPFAWPEEA